ncbi:MAG: protein kinase, partial [bacterium]
RILEKLGTGGMGVVYKAEDIKRQRTIALKVLRAEAIGHPVAKKRFIREARAASALNNPNITTIYEVVEWQGQDFICMGYVGGESFMGIISKNLPQVLNQRKVTDYTNLIFSIGTSHLKTA